MRYVVEHATIQSAWFRSSDVPPAADDPEYIEADHANHTVANRDREPRKENEANARVRISQSGDCQCGVDGTARAETGEDATVSCERGWRRDPSG